MLKRFVLFAAAATLFVGAGNLYAQCEGHGAHGAGHECSTEGKSCCSSKKAKTTSDSPSISMKEISLDELRGVIAAHKPVILDARDEQSYNAGHIDGAVLYTSNVLPANKNTPLVFYCGGLKCPASAKAAKKAIEQGYTNVMVFKGGWAEWSKSQI